MRTMSTHYPVLLHQRPPGFIEARRRICPSPHLCLDPPGGTEDAICGPCDDETLRALARASETASTQSDRQAAKSDPALISETSMELAPASSRGARRLNIDLDQDADVLYMSLGEPVASHVDEAPRGLLLRWASADGLPSGVTALGFHSNWSNQLSAFCSAVAQHLCLSANLVEEEVNRALQRQAFATKDQMIQQLPIPQRST